MEIQRLKLVSDVYNQSSGGWREEEEWRGGREGEEWREWGGGVSRQCALPAQACQPSYFKNLGLGCLVRVATIELLTSHAHYRRLTIPSQKPHQ